MNLGSGDSVVLHGVAWKLHRRLRKMPENYNIRMTYDRGELEIMSPSRAHEEIALLFGTLIDLWTIELDVAIVGCWTMTIRRATSSGGFEPDNCYYVQHERQMRNKKDQLQNRSATRLGHRSGSNHKLLSKMAIYAAFRVPELWC